jgi:hypothetical protein
VRRLSRAWSGVMTVALLWALPSVALACPVCFSAKEEAERVAFLGTTVFLTALPLIMIGAAIYWLASRSVEPEEVEPASTEPTEEPRLGA